MYEKALKYGLFKKFKTKIFIFEYFSKNPSEINFTHLFTLSDTQHLVRKLFYFVCRDVQGGPKAQKKNYI